jgi:hypothetical protein
MSRSARTTIVFALISGTLMLPAVELLRLYWAWPTAVKVVLWIDLAAYAVLMARWSKTAPGLLVMPFAIVLGAALWPQSYWGFFTLTLGVFSWIRSGICFNRMPMRAILAEAVTVIGGVLLLALLGGHGTVAMALKLCLFLLVQSLYFFIVPSDATALKRGAAQDTFEEAVKGLTREIDGLCQ